MRSRCGVRTYLSARTESVEWVGGGGRGVEGEGEAT